MTNFQAWLNQADIPERDPYGRWYDLEDGRYYEHSFDYAAGKPARKIVSAKAQDARSVAKMFGGKALTGTAKQKEWGEKIRAAALAGMNQDQAEMAADPDGLGRAAKFWIENRARSTSEIGAFFMEQKALMRKAQSLKTAGKVEEYAAVAAQYNALTAKWGF